MADWTKRFSLEGKAALVTGATKGIGLETCKVLADAGADIAAVGRDAAGLQEINAAVEAKGRRCVAIAEDMATVDGPIKAAKEALAAFGTHSITRSSGSCQATPSATVSNRSECFSFFHASWSRWCTELPRKLAFHGIQPRARPSGRCCST